jgi:hypothetical protein
MMQRQETAIAVDLQIKHRQYLMDRIDVHVGGIRGQREEQRDDAEREQPSAQPAVRVRPVSLSRREPGWVNDRFSPGHYGPPN